MKARLTRRTETVSLGTEHLGRIRQTDRGFEVFGPLDGYVCTATTIEHARRILYEMHQEGEKGLSA